MDYLLWMGSLANLVIWRTCLVALVLFPMIGLSLSPPEDAQISRPRVIISTDIGGSDPDDHQSMIHYLVYADCFDTEGLISSPPKEGRADAIRECLDAYEKDFANLKSWSGRYPEPAELRKLVRQGAIDSQKGEVPGKDLSKGAALIVERALVDDPRPLYLLVWGALTDVAQAVHANPEIKKKIRVYSIGSWNTRHGQRERDYLFREHPDLWWIESDTTFRGMYLGGEQGDDLANRSFPAKHVSGHGELGRLFMRKKADIKMGDSPSVLYLLDGKEDEPGSDHWGGAYERPDPVARPNYWHDDPDPEQVVAGKKGAKSVSRWRKIYLRDWEKRMDRARSPRPGE